MNLYNMTEDQAQLVIEYVEQTRHGLLTGEEMVERIGLLFPRQIQSLDGTFFGHPIDDVVGPVIEE